ncbi:MAG: sigma-70 family RNA polymerase sigma factor [Clostridia bacterium]|nr:sigma-70 family RNA polymerase sigma factor [Clostridia bacterium]
MDAHELIEVFFKEENRKELSLYAYMLMGNKDDALDLLSDLLIEIYENPKMQYVLDPIPYFKTTLRNKAYNITKRNSRVVPYAPDMLSVSEPKLYNDAEQEYEDMRTRQEWRNRLLKSYSPEMVDAFLRCYLDGYSIKELAAALNMSENALSQQFRRMRKKMRHEFAWMLEIMLCVLTGL